MTWRRHGVLLGAVAYLAGIFALGLKVQPVIVGAFVLAPLLVAYLGTLRDTAIVGVLAVALAVAGTVHDAAPVGQDLVRDLVVAVGVVTAVAFGRTRQRFSRELTVARARSRLGRVSAALSSAATTEQVGEAVVDVARRAFGADAASVNLVQEDERLRVRVFGTPVLDARSPLAVESPSSAAVRAGAAVYVAGEADLRAAYPALAGQLLASGIRAVLAVPLQGRTGLIGTMALSYATPFAWTPELADLAAELGEQVAVALERARLLESERLERSRAERLQRATAALSAAVTSAEVAAAVVEDAAAALGLFGASLYVPDDDGETLLVAGRTASMASVPLRPIPLQAGYATAETYWSRQALWFDEPEQWSHRYERGAALLTSHHAGAALLPLLASGSCLGVLVLRFHAGQELDARFRQYMQAFADLAAQALDRARLHEAERTIARRLQDSLVSRPDDAIAEVAVATRYIPASEGIQVGGDWCDVFRVDDSHVALTVGDVVGHGLEAAAGMGRLHSAVVSLALGSPGPARLLERLDTFARRSRETFCASTVFAVLDTVRGELRWSRAGHPPMLLVPPDGAAVFVEAGHGPPLGIEGVRTRREASVRLAPGTSLVLYTDGLVDNRARRLDDGLAELLEVVTPLAEAGPDELCEHVAKTMLGEAARSDDTALLVVRYDPALAPRLRRVLPPDLTLLGETRTVLRSWLVHRGVAGREVDDLVLAAGEALANAAEHAYAELPATGGVDGDATGGSDARIVELEAWVEADVVTITVRDRGLWRVQDEADPERRFRGRGTGIMHALADATVASSGSGTLVTLRRRLGERVPV